MKQYSTEYLAYCAGYLIEGQPEREKDVNQKTAKKEVDRRIKESANTSIEESIRLIVLKCAGDFKVLEERKEEYYDGTRGPLTSIVVQKCYAFGREWARHFIWTDKGLGIREVWYE